MMLVALTGCATSSKNITASYVSPLAYKDYDCDQLAAEHARVQRKASELSGQIDKRASGDRTQAAVAAVLFWPALFALGNNDEQNAEFARLKGESDAIEQAMIQNKCTIEKDQETKEDVAEEVTEEKV